MAHPPHATSRLLASFHDSYRDLLRYLARRTGCADQARDVAHDTWLRVAELARQGREPALAGEGDARGYLFAMARNIAIDRQRHEGVAQRHGAEAHEAASTAQARGPDASEAAMYRQAVAAVEQALAALPERARQVFLRSRVHGEDQAALALEYGVSRNTVERDMIQALDRVQAAMERWHAGQGGAPAAGAAPARTGRRRTLSALLGVAGLAVGGAGGWAWWRAAALSYAQEWASGAGPAERHALPEGSALTLDAQSRVQVAYGATRRGVRLLAGAAFFEVTPDPARRFEVEVPGDASAAGPQPGVRVTVLGTRFGVERLPGGRVEVQVESGRVRVELLDAQGSVRGTHELAPGEAARFDPRAPGQAPQALRLRTPQDAAAWRHGLLAFDDVPLGETVERLRRYLPRPVELDPGAAALRLSGQVRTVDAEAFLRALPGSLPVRMRWSGDRWQMQKI
ncbi:sigma-70 family RNA polymerase sigma factor [Xylophilus sp. Leaf220]|uniref:sigma-70 family RNA polymerase sigma factor n=1 Tax=Xylophilus sp. Leaf220 TaxID=1735686 RepID=UPI0006F42BA2|nr:sigma-70 family RNA polymerase sigma factor [Xylophilus sp. Leaf220]KQM80535.1 hypothetical protein ASE76_02695 [Xylophilus sp. Leaf220]